MKKFTDGLKRFVREEDAPTMVEYGLLLVFTTMAVAFGAAALGVDLRTFLTQSGDSIEAIAPGAVPTNPAP